jgi:hypothetical protein
VKPFPFTPRGGATVARMRAVLAIAVALFAMSTIVASSASAFSWWVGSPSEPKMLAEGARLPINSGGSVRSAFTLKWLHGYEVKCSGITYDELYLEGPVFLGAHSIAFEGCASKKPKGTTVVGGQIDTTPLTGEIKPAGSKVEFLFRPASGSLFAKFDLKRAVSHKVHKSKRKRVRHRECTIEVSVFGHASGDLGDATTISTAKTFEFGSKALEISQTKRCHKTNATDSVSRSARPATTIEEQEAEEKAQEEQEARELKEEEELEALEREEEEALECKEHEKSPEECKLIDQKLKEKHEEVAEVAEEQKEEAAEEAEEEEARPEEEEVKPIEGNKGKTGYSAFEGWGVL